MNKIDTIGEDIPGASGGEVDGYDLAGQVIGAAMKAHNAFGPGFLESVYQRSLVIELRETGHTVESEKRIDVKYRDQLVGEFVADLLVDGALIVENKAQQHLSAANEVQLVNYLAATGIDEGLLLNFGGSRLEFRKKCRLFKPEDPILF